MKTKITPISNLHEGSVCFLSVHILFKNRHDALSNMVLSKFLSIWNYTLLNFLHSFLLPTVPSLQCNSFTSINPEDQYPCCTSETVRQLYSSFRRLKSFTAIYISALLNKHPVCNMPVPQGHKLSVLALKTCTNNIRVFSSRYGKFRIGLPCSAPDSSCVAWRELLYYLMYIICG